MISFFAVKTIKRKNPAFETLHRYEQEYDINLNVLSW